MRPSSRAPARRSSILMPAARSVVIGATLVAGGCASSQSPQYAGVHQQPRPASERSWKVEIEEDGKPAQAPPVRRMRPDEDDPTQPWSRNYGRGDAVRPPLAADRDDAVPAPARQAWPQPIETRGQTAALPRGAARLTDAEADVIIARAVNAHEMRRP